MNVNNIREMKLLYTKMDRNGKYKECCIGNAIPGHNDVIP